MGRMITIVIACMIIAAPTAAGPAPAGLYRGVYRDFDYAEWIYVLGGRAVYRINMCEGFNFATGPWKAEGGRYVFTMERYLFSSFFRDDRLIGYPFEVSGEVMTMKEAGPGCDTREGIMFRKAKTVLRRVKGDNLRLRTAAVLSAKVIRLLKKSEPVEVIDVMRQETVQGMKGSWVMVRAGEDFGFCFDAFLE